jgi:hypothetical protein
MHGLNSGRNLLGPEQGKLGAQQGLIGLTDILYQHDKDYCIVGVPSRWGGWGIKSAAQVVDIRTMNGV